MSTYHRALKKLEEAPIPVPGSTPIPDSPALRKEKGGAGDRLGGAGRPEGERPEGLTFSFTPEDLRELRVLLDDNPDNRLSDKLRNFILSSGG